MDWTLLRMLSPTILVWGVWLLSVMTVPELVKRAKLGAPKPAAWWAESANCAVFYGFFFVTNIGAPILVALVQPQIDRGGSYIEGTFTVVMILNALIALAGFGVCIVQLGRSIATPDPHLKLVRNVSAAAGSWGLSVWVVPFGPLLVPLCVWALAARQISRSECEARHRPTV